MFSTAFPCPPCAKFIASSGIANLYYVTGYATGNGLDSLRDAGVKVIQVVTDEEFEPFDEASRVYPEKASS
jgi:deoxycytidylate deaminase